MVATDFLEDTVFAEKGSVFQHGTYELLALT